MAMRCVKRIAVYCAVDDPNANRRTDMSDRSPSVLSLNRSLKALNMNLIALPIGEAPDCPRLRFSLSLYVADGTVFAKVYCELEVRMKTIIALSILLSTLAQPALGESSQLDS